LDQEPPSPVDANAPLKEKTEPAASGTGSQTVSAEIRQGEPGPRFRGRIVKDYLTSGTSKQPTGEGSSQRHVGDEIPEERIVEELEPEEANIYGRIRHSFERGEYEPAIELCDNFLQTFPGSPMAENVSFLKGDAEFGLIK
jgi:hypothetical protein